MEAWGAQGLYATDVTIPDNQLGKGGYSNGNMFLASNSTIFICVGGTSDQNSGYNGGTSRGGTWGGGGGCTSYTLKNRGILKNFESYKSEVLLVAGGAGGVDYGGKGGDGGGEIGGSGLDADLTTIKTTGGTQTSGGTGVYSGSFGQGANYQTGTDGCAGGGGGWYGGGGPLFNKPGGAGGGSGYINTTYITNGNMLNGIKSGSGSAIISWHPNI